MEPRVRARVRVRLRVRVMARVRVRVGMKVSRGTITEDEARSIRKIKVRGLQLGSGLGGLQKIRYTGYEKQCGRVYSPVYVKPFPNI